MRVTITVIMITGERPGPNPASPIQTDRINTRT